MEIIQQFAENETYLYAIRQQFQVHVPISVKDVEPKVVTESIPHETMSRVLTEPLGTIFFHYHLRKLHCMEMLLFLEEVQSLNELPAEGSYRNRIARCIVRKYVKKGSGMAIALPRIVRQRLVNAIEQTPQDQPIDVDLFSTASRCVRRDLLIEGFSSFLGSTMYRRLLSFRQKEKEFVSRDDFEFIRVLGQGGFGKVYAARKNDTMQMYACKAMSKERVIERKREQLLQNERNILTKVKHTFIIGLNYAFQDNDYLYFVLDLVTGGELEFHLKHRGKFGKTWSRFFLAGIVLALEHLHNQGIVYRDLKPENVLLDADGYVRLADLGLCAEIEPGQTLVEHCGTRSFMAPEQCTSTYRFEVDWWALGVTAYKILTGRNPFTRIWREKKKKEGIVSTIMTKSIRRLHDVKSSFSSRHRASIDRSKTARKSIIKNNKPIKEEPAVEEGKEGDEEKEKENDNGQKEGDDGDDAENDAKDIEAKFQQKKESQRRRKTAILRVMFEGVLDDLSWPDSIDAPTKAFVEGLLKMNPEERLGHNGAQEVKDHSFFEGFNWEKLLRKHLVPPFVPSSHIVHAEYVEPPDPVHTKKKFKFFEDFDYVAHTALQKEIVNTMHDTQDLMEYRKHLPTKKDII